jgi:hypothetical protein
MAQYALIEVLGDGDEIRVIGLDSDAVVLMTRARQRAESTRDDVYRDMTRDELADDVPDKPDVKERTYVRCGFEYVVEIEEFGMSWIVNKVEA